MSATGADRFFMDAIHAALAAGAAIMRVYEGTFTVTTKDDQSPLTKADLDAQNCIMDVLGSSGIPVISEESAIPDYASRSGWLRYWLVDPLDGTKEFIHRNGEFTVNIAMMEQDNPLFGVVFSPATDELYAGWSGRGFWRITSASRCRIDSMDDLSDFVLQPQPSEHSGYTVAVSRSHSDEQTARYLEQLKVSKGDIQVLQAGSSMKFCLVAAGKADEYPRFGPTHEWDTAAGHAVLLAAGKDICSFPDGSRLVYNKPVLKHGAFVAR